MSLFGGKRLGGRYGVLIDVGSGSVLAAIVHSKQREPHPKVVWSHREHAPLRNIDSLEQSSKAVMTALINVAMRLDAEGRKALHDYDSAAKISSLQCGVSAPWSYTVTKTVNLKQDTPFRITEQTIEDLEQTVEEKILADLRDNDVLQELNLEIISQTTSGMQVNGYTVKYPIGEEATLLQLSHTSAVSQRYLLDSLVELRDKVFTDTSIETTSFILIFYEVVRSLLPAAKDICLVDVTYEATEIGVVREGVLNYATHIPFGSFSLAREISQASGIPLHEAFAHLHADTPFSFMDKLPKEQRKEVEQIFEAYVARLADLFKETGDALLIPKQLCLHADKNSEGLFAELVERAAKRNLKKNPHISQLSNLLSELPPERSPDCPLIVSARFFHTKGV
jgi:cell division ATPase FtsA